MIKIIKHTIYFRLIAAAICVIVFLSALLPFTGRANADSAYIKISSYVNGTTINTSYINLTVDYYDPGVFSETTTWDIEITLKRIASLPEGPDDYISDRGITFGDYVNSRSGNYSAGNVGPEFSGETYYLRPGQYEITAVLSAWTIGGYSKIATDRITIWYRPSASGAAPPTSTGTTTSGGGGSSGGAVAGIVLGVGAVVGGAVWLLRKLSGGKSAPVKTAPRPQTTYHEAETVEQAAARLAAVKRNGELLDRYHRLRQVVYNDDRLLDFVDNARNSIIGKNSQINEANLNRLENTLKYWIQRDTLGVKMPEYGGTDVMVDLLKAPVTGWTGIFVRAGAAFVTAGYSEMVFNPLSAMVTMRDSINQDKSTLQAVTDGYKQSVTHLAIGEAGRLVKYAKPYYDAWQKSRAIKSFNEANPDIAHELSTIEQLAKQGQTTRDGFMKSSEVVKVGETAAAELDHAEKLALELANNPVARKALAERSDLVSARVKEVMGVAKQKVYENARNEAAEEVMKQMAKDGINTAENPFFIKQTGTHAQPGNPGWNSLKSDFDHTVEFGSKKYNDLYENTFNNSLKAQGTTSQAMDANVYQGTTGPGAYEGGALKFVDHYNQTTGSDIMVRNVKGVTTITRETPQTSTSLLSTMNKADVQSATANYQKFFVKDMAKGGSLDNQIMNGSKTVSRNAGQYSTKYVDNFQNTGKVNYQPPDAAKVADLIKKRGFTVDDAMKKVGYNGSKEQLLNDYKQIMGM